MWRRNAVRPARSADRRRRPTTAPGWRRSDRPPRRADGRRHAARAPGRVGGYRRRRVARDSALVIERVGECRVVVTGSYHGAVFALAQGIPVVALVKSPYYVNKMAGLARPVRNRVRARASRRGQCVGTYSRRDRSRVGRGRTRARTVAAGGSRQIERGRRAYARLVELVPPDNGERAVDGLAGPPLVQSRERGA